MTTLVAAAEVSAPVSRSSLPARLTFLDVLGAQRTKSRPRVTDRWP